MIGISQAATLQFGDIGNIELSSVQSSTLFNYRIFLTEDLLLRLKYYYFALTLDTTHETSQAETPGHR